MVICKTGLIALMAFGFLISGCQQNGRLNDNLELLIDGISQCGSTSPNGKVDLFTLDSGLLARIEATIPRFLLSTTALPRVVPNDNRIPAGTSENDTLKLNLEVVLADFRVETSDRPGLSVAVIGEKGKKPSVPGPLVRVKTGTTIKAAIHNTLQDSSITVFGFQTRPAGEESNTVIKPGQVGLFTFDAGSPGTYMYWIQLGAGIDSDLGEEEQLAGAFIIDPEGDIPPDRVFVMNIFSTLVQSDVFEGWLEGLTVNGISWPFTERMTPDVGDTLRWRIINASNRNHPMHLHGFYYDVLSVGTPLNDKIYLPEYKRTVVTETLTGKTTMMMEWVASRPGNWLFHCHLSFHVSAEIRLPGAAAMDEAGHECHMAGLVIGILIKPGPSDLIFKGKSVDFTLYAHEFDTVSTHKYKFSLDSVPRNNGVNQFNRPGPLLILNQYQPTFVTVENRMSIPTGIHWHGLEIDSWSDGVPEWSASDNRISPTIKPGEQFTYKLGLMRPGSFIYHSHLDDVHQLSSGLYGPMIVIGENQTYNPDTDHIYIKGWKISKPRSLNDTDLNGWTETPVQHATVGEEHRLRLMNIGPAGRLSVQMKLGEQPVPLRLIAKDGADLPAHQQAEVEISPFYYVGETADYLFVPTAAGTYNLVIRGTGRTQVWEVSDIIPNKIAMK